MKLDFIMKLFLALIVVFFVIIAVYYTANGLAGIFGIHFKIQKPGLYNGNLEKLGVKNISKIEVGTAKYSDCLNYCKNNEFEPHILGNCEDQCAFICNQTGHCINVTGTFRIATLGDSATFSIVLNAYANGKKQEFTIDSETFDNLPEVSYIKHTFFLPDGDPYKEDTFIDWESGGMQGKIYIGKTKAIRLIHSGNFCGEAYSCCSVFNESREYFNNNKLDSNTKSNTFSISNCKQISISLVSNCKFPIMLDEEEKGQSINEFKFNSNGTYQLVCPRNSGDKITLTTNLENCEMDYNLTVFEGLVNKHLSCYNNSQTLGGKSIYACTCTNSGINPCGPTCS